MTRPNLLPYAVLVMLVVLLAFVIDRFMEGM